MAIWPEKTNSLHPLVQTTTLPHSSIYFLFFIFYFILFFFAVLGIHLRAFALSLSTNPFL
jgi:hypothetical protein